MNKKSLLMVLSGVVVLFTSIGALLARNSSSASAYGYLTIFTNVIHLVDSNYVEAVDFNKVMDSAMYGMVESLDSESFFIKGKDLDSYKKELEDLPNKAGVGITLARRFGMVVVVAVEKGSSADEKKIKAGDFIRSVDGQYVQQIPLYKIYELMKGDPGTEAKISVFRGSLEKPEDFSLARRSVAKPYVESYVIQQKIGYISIHHLLPGTENEIEKKLETFQRQGIQKLILDVRACADEDQDAAVKVADLFVGNVPIVQINGREGLVKKIAGETHTAYSGELLVLMDYTTSGGAEIVAAAVQDAGIGHGFGTRSFGRGGIQKLLPAGDNWVVLTTQKYVSPKGKSLMNGVDPETVYREDVKTADQQEGEDRMLNKAIEKLRHPEQKAA